MNDDEAQRRERARRLREEVDALKSGERGGPPRTPREFVTERAREAEENEEEDEEEEPPAQRTNSSRSSDRASSGS